MLREENATVLPFRDAALRRPIDVVAWMNSHAPAAQPGDARDNVIPLTHLAAVAPCAAPLLVRRPPGGEAA